jgi:xanthine dehydrogenase accessory factor
VEDDLGTRIRDAFPASCEVIRYGVSAEEARRFGLPCGGTLQLVVEPLTASVTLQPALASVERRELRVRQVNLKTGATRFQAMTPDSQPGLDGDLLTQVFGPRWRMLLIGASQVSHYLAQMAPTLDYRVLICDPRREYRDSFNVPAVEWRSGMPDDVVRDIRPDQRTVILALTHDPKLDDMALMEALMTDAFYVGALGSKVTNANRRSRLAQLELKPEQIARLHGPVGLPIGSRTPPEIALSILAELIALRSRAGIAGHRALSPVVTSGVT